MSRGAKIVCTLGPAARSESALRALVDAGMDVARLNFSHGTHEQHAELHGHARRVSGASGRALGILADLQGPKIRLGTFERGSAALETGAEFILTTESVAGDQNLASTTYPELSIDVRAGDSVLLDDGLVRLQVVAVEGNQVRTRVVEGGTVSDHKGINLPGVRVSSPTLTDKDLDDLRFALSLPVDMVALSFVRSPEDAVLVRRAMAGSRVPVIAKIEKPEAVERLDAIIEAFDGVMVARGDLGVELSPEQVPLVQKRAVRLARAWGKPVIVATQMLDSMITRSRPTRAEASDVANAVLDGADALMLSGETSVGAHPVESVAMMSRIIAATEADALGLIPPLGTRPATPHEAIAAAATTLAIDLGARALVAFTHTGATARRLACHRTRTPLLAFTTDPAVRSRLALVWGVESFVMPAVTDTDAMVTQVDLALRTDGRCRPGDLVVIVAGTPFGTEGATNAIRVHRIGTESGSA